MVLIVTEIQLTTKKVEPIFFVFLDMDMKCILFLFLPQRLQHKETFVSN